ncbi:MAG: Hsp20/alpha crystallin family protein [bacterium]
MAIIKWNPWSPMYEDMEKFFSDFPSNVPDRMAHTIMPALDIYETKEAVIAELPLAGMDPNKVNVTIENDVLNVSGEMERKSEVDEKDFYRKEVRYGSFARTIQLPTHVIGEKALASYKDGMLKITVPKAEPKKATAVRIEVKK